MPKWEFKEIKNGIKVSKIIPIIYSHTNYYRNKIYQEIIDKGGIDIKNNGEFFYEKDLIHKTKTKGFDYSFLLNNIQIDIQYSSYNYFGHENLIKPIDTIFFSLFISNNKFDNKKELDEIIQDITPRLIYE
jgi:hypothetical protein